MTEPEQEGSTQQLGSLGWREAVWGGGGGSRGAAGPSCRILVGAVCCVFLSPECCGCWGPGEQRAGPGTVFHGGRGAGQSGACQWPSSCTAAAPLGQRGEGQSLPPPQGPWWVGVMSVRDLVSESSMLKTANTPCPLRGLVARATTEGKAWDLWAPRSSSDLLGISWQIELGQWFPAWGTRPTGGQFDVYGGQFENELFTVNLLHFLWF